MINKGFRFAAGLLAVTLLLSDVPTDVFASKTAESDYITTTANFTAGAHSAIHETIVLNEENVGEQYAGITVNDTPIVTDSEASQYADMAIANVNVSVYIRKEPNKDSDMVGKLYKNGAATVLETLDGWYKIQSGNVTGYAPAEFLIVGDPEVCKAAAQRIGKVTASALNLRKNPSTDSTVRVLITSGKKLTVLDESIEGWLKVQYKNYTGYVSSQYVTVETVYSQAETKAEEAARLKAEEEERKRQEEAKKKPSSNNYKPPTGGTGQDVVNYAMQFIGTPYKYGGTDLYKGIDCSGFVQQVYAAFGVKLPRTSKEQRSVGYAVKESQLKPGDIVCYSGHVGIYVGNGNIIHASNKNKRIVVSQYKFGVIKGFRRIF